MAMTDEQEKEIKEQLENAKKEAQKLKSDLGRLKKGSGGNPAPKKDDAKKTTTTEENEENEENEEDDLLSKAKKEKEKGEKGVSDTRKIENALKFNLGVNDYVKNHKDLLPQDVEGILKIAEKENYDTALAKANAVKVGIVTSFFAVQANVDLLTPAQKSQLEEFLKLTKNGKEDKAEHIFENIFEPAIETFKKVKKAEEVGKARNGFSTGSSVENDYKVRLMNQAKKTHLREKGE